jgi:2-oxoglutarate/2-oxoacid ferredoxin oxidoreductase subunit alpha
VPELNMGQLTQLLRAEFLLPAQGMSKQQGQPFKVTEIRKGIDSMLRGEKI